MFYKILIPAFVATLSFSATSFAGSRCYQAINPERITVTVEEENVPTPVVEKARSARIKMLPPSKRMTYETALFVIHTKHFRYETYAINFPDQQPGTRGETQYSVECDGGNMVVKAYDATGTITANSNGIMGTAVRTGGDELCSNAKAVFEDLRFKHVRCSK